MYRIVRNNLRLKQYWIKNSNAYINPQQQRLVFCQGWQKQLESLSEKVVWSDEKWFAGNNHPNRQNDKFRGLIHPHEVEETLMKQFYRCFGLEMKIAPM